MNHRNALIMCILVTDWVAQANATHCNDRSPASVQAEISVFCRGAPVYYQRNRQKLSDNLENQVIDLHNDIDILVHLLDEYPPSKCADYEKYQILHHRNQHFTPDAADERYRIGSKMYYSTLIMDYAYTMTDFYTLIRNNQTAPGDPRYANYTTYSMLNMLQCVQEDIVYRTHAALGLCHNFRSNMGAGELPCHGAAVGETIPCLQRPTWYDVSKLTDLTLAEKYEMSTCMWCSLLQFHDIIVRFIRSEHIGRPDFQATTFPSGNTIQLTTPRA